MAIREMREELDKLREIVLAKARESALAERIRDARVEAAQDNDGSDFLRVIIQVEPGVALGFEDVKALLAVIRDSVGQRDDRHASVRFLDAA